MATETQIVKLTEQVLYEERLDLEQQVADKQTALKADKMQLETIKAQEQELDQASEELQQQAQQLVQQMEDLRQQVNKNMCSSVLLLILCLQMMYRLMAYNARRMHIIRQANPWKY